MCSPNSVPILGCEQRHLRGGSTLDPMLVADTKEVTLAWLKAALEHAYSHGHHLALTYLEAVMEDVVFEEEITARTASVLG